MKLWKMIKKTFNELTDCKKCGLRDNCNTDTKYRTCDSFLENRFQIKTTGGYAVYVPLEQIKERRF